MVLPPPEATSFGPLNFASAKLGDRRRIRSLVSTAHLLVRNPGGTLPKMISSPTAVDGLYRWARAKAVSHQVVLEPRHQLTFQRMRDCDDVVLLIQDTTMLDSTAITSLYEELGIVGKGRHACGDLCHNTLAIAAMTRSVLGLANQILFRREEAPKGETRAQRRSRQGREGRLWTSASRAIPAAPEGRAWIEVGDRVPTCSSSSTTSTPPGGITSSAPRTTAGSPAPVRTAPGDDPSCTPPPAARRRWGPGRSRSRRRARSRPAPLSWSCRPRR